MNTTTLLRGMSTVSFWAKDIKAASAWYADLLEAEPYFVRPNTEAPEYVEFRIGDYQHELGIIDSRYRRGASDEPGGAVLYWHVDNIDEALAKLIDKGAAPYEPRIEREAGFITASVVDPFGNIIGLMYSPHYLQVLIKRS